MILFTARYSVSDADRLDITRAGCDRARKEGKPTPGEFLAPAASIVFPTLAAMKRAKSGADRERIWAHYEASYHHQMVAAYRLRRVEWALLLVRPRVVLVCFCADPSRCHRTLAASYLAKLGADYRGEIKASCEERLAKARRAAR